MKWTDILYADTILGKLKVTLIIISSSWWKRGEAWEIMGLLNHWIIFVYWGWWISIKATKICYFGLALSGIGSQPTRLSDIFSRMFLKENPHRKKYIYFKLTKLENYMRYQVGFLLPLHLQKTCYLGLYRKILLANEFAEFFTFDFFDLLILIPGLHCHIAFVGSAICNSVRVLH